MKFKIKLGMLRKFVEVGGTIISLHKTKHDTFDLIYFDDETKEVKYKELYEHDLNNMEIIE